MNRAQKTRIWPFLFCCLSPACAQDTQFLPEIDTYLKLNSDFRLSFQIKGEREAGDQTQSLIGPSVQLYLKPLLDLTHVPVFGNDDARSRFLVVEAGFRYITAPNSPIERRILVAFTSHYALKGGFLISDRNRADLDWQNAIFSWRYRNKFTVERPVAIVSYHLIPYVAGEPFYDSQYSKWSTTALYAGCIFPIRKHVELDTYYKHENNTGKRPNSQDEEFGLALHLFFSVEQK